jgi:hypothetical protein
MSKQDEKVDLSILESEFAQLERQGVRYHLGAKASWKSLPSQITALDCSGYVYWGIARASHGALTLPHGSQNQRAYAEQNWRQVDYIEAAHYMTERRLFAAFIKPFEHGCGDVGHVWLLSTFNDGNNSTFARTMESHGGAGIDSRNWNYPTLLNEVFSCFEIPTA